MFDVKEYKKQWRLENKEKIDARTRELRELNKEKVNAYHRAYRKEYRIKNKDKIRKYENTLREKRRDIINEKQRERRKDLYEKSPWIKTLDGIRIRCAQKSTSYYKYNIKNYLNVESIKILWFRDEAYNMERPSIDRIDTTQHYTFDNCRFLELSDNLKRPRRVKHGKSSGEPRPASR